MVLKKTNKSSEKKKEKISYKTKEEIAKEIISKFPNEEEKDISPKGPGRPIKITSTTLQKLRVCFAVDMTNAEAAYFCGMCERTLQYYLEENPKFLQEKDILKKSISLQAKFNIARTIKLEESTKGGGTSNSWKRLEKKDPEFRDKLQIDGNITTQMSDEDKEIYNKILQKNLKTGNK